jgi:hypothetical protein
MKYYLAITTTIVAIFFSGCQKDSDMQEFPHNRNSALVQEYNSPQPDLPVLWPDKVNGRTSEIVIAAQQAVHSTLDTDNELQAFIDRIGQPSWEYLHAGEVYLFPTFGDSTVAKGCMVYDPLQNIVLYDASMTYRPEVLYPFENYLVNECYIENPAPTSILETRADDQADCVIYAATQSTITWYSLSYPGYDDTGLGLSRAVAHDVSMPVRTTSVFFSTSGCDGGGGGTTTSTPTFGGGGSTSNDELRRACANKDNNGTDCMICMNYAGETASIYGALFSPVFERCGCDSDQPPRINELIQSFLLLSVEGISDCILCRRTHMAGTNNLWSLAEEYADVEFACIDENPIDRLNEVACGDGGPYSQDYGAIQEVAAELEAEKNRGNFKKGEIEDFLTNYDFPCDDRSDEEIKADLLEQACNYKQDHIGIDRSYGMEWLEMAMDGVDKIVIPKNFDDDCPCFDYLYKKLLKSEEGNWLCDIVKGVKSTENYTMTIDVGNYSKIQHQIPQGGTNSSTLVIPQSLCNLGATGNAQQKLQASAEFIHEFLHAHFFTLLNDAMPNEGFTLAFGTETWSSPEWEALIRAKYSVPDGTPLNGNHHADFFTFLKESIIDVLWHMNGEQGDRDHYEYYAHIILNTQDLAKEGSPYAQSLGLQNEAGDIIFSLNSYKSQWDALEFNPGC